jgi:hypothetical protein
VTPTKRSTLKISKTDAAKRQLETAVRLWFFSGDPVSIHTLTAAAHQVLHDIGKKRGAPTLLRDLPGVRPENLRHLRTLVSRYENFFKHADQDSGAVLDFNPEATEIYMLDAVLAYESLTQEVVPVLSTFKAWVFINQPYLMNEPDRKKLIERVNKTGIDITQVPKAEFFIQYLQALMKLGVS